MTGNKIPVKAVIFDFDGVILESADIKTEAFTELFKDYPEHSEAILNYHLGNQGISRYKKFEWIYQTLLQQEYNETIAEQLGISFSGLVFDKIIKAPFVPGAMALLQALKEKEIPCFIASGTPDDELLEIVKQRNLPDYFISVYGSQRSKVEIIRLILDQYNWDPAEVVFVGDAETDFFAARATLLHFFGRTTPYIKEFWNSENVMASENIRDIEHSYTWLENQPFPDSKPFGTATANQHAG
jgi:beta-phosphoglucomutase